MIDTITLPNDAASALQAVTLQQVQSLIASASGNRPGRVYTANDWTWLDRSQGLILQWGYSGNSITFPIAFPNACFLAMGATNRSSAGSGGFNHTASVSKTGAYILFDAAPGWWFAIGN